jgi:hypothetical protein
VKTYEHLIEKLNKQYRGKQKLQNEKLEISQENEVEAGMNNNSA